MNAFRDLVAVALIATFVPQAPTHAQESLPERVPFYEAHTQTALDTLERMYTVSGQRQGAIYCFGNAYVDSYGSVVTTRAVTEAMWSLDRCVSTYYSQRSRTWQQFLATQPIRRYLENRNNDR